MDASTGCLSVVMPAYNEEQTIDEIIHRVLARTEVGELLIINDASTDKTWENLQKFADNPRIRLFNQEVNQGKGAALIRGFREAARSSSFRTRISSTRRRIIRRCWPRCWPARRMQSTDRVSWEPPGRSAFSGTKWAINS